MMRNRNNMQTYQGVPLEVPEHEDESGNVREEKIYPRFKIGHGILLVVMIVLMLVASAMYPVIDLDTLKPNADFHPTLKVVSYYSNIPIKFGAVHVFLYGWELYHDPRAGERHIGQRLTTLWLQFFEHPRWGQHFHMQTETLLQVADIFDRESTKRSRPSPSAIKAVLLSIAILMIVTNFITSMAYHTLYEQVIGAIFAVAKLFGFDYLKQFEHINSMIGASYTNRKALLFGSVCLLAIVLSAKFILLDPTSQYQKLVVHPTTLATGLFLGCRIALTAFPIAQA